MNSKTAARNSRREDDVNKRSTSKSRQRMSENEPRVTDGSLSLTGKKERHLKSGDSLFHI